MREAGGGVSDADQPPILHMCVYFTDFTLCSSRFAQEKGREGEKTATIGGNIDRQICRRKFYLSAVVLIPFSQPVSQPASQCAFFYAHAAIS